MTFPQFFRALYERPPFPWQERLANRVCREGWPEVVDLPTGTGKTACMDIAIYSLAAGALAAGTKIPRRIFFVVDRRVVVSEAYQRGKRIAAKLEAAETGILKEIADQLRSLSLAGPLTAFELRGGIYRDQAWIESPLQPMIVASTVDQIGSRLLFRGYGVSPETQPIHAAFIANDSLIFLDEAHNSRAFAETLAAIERYRSSRWASAPLNSPFAYVEMTATPSRRTKDAFRLDAADRQNPVLLQRLNAPKPTRIKIAKSSKKVVESLVEEVLSFADELKGRPEFRAAAVMVNRVATANRVHEALQAKGKITHLVVGRMRPLDREDLMRNLKPFHSGELREITAQPVFVVSTQCLEVGADLDFDVLVTECASIDALQQRFGRLNRMGQFPSACASIVFDPSKIEPRKPDPIYGSALPATMAWLQNAGTLNFGIEALSGEPRTVSQQISSLTATNHMRKLGDAAPVLLPSHLDAFVQTSPRPVPEPDPALFLHGAQDNQPDVLVVWRIDLTETDSPEQWKTCVTAFPPSSAEAMPVPIGEFVRWMRGTDEMAEDASDLEGEPYHEDTGGKKSKQVLAWRGKDSEVFSQYQKIRPGDTLVLPTSYANWNVFGHKPEHSKEDLAENAWYQTRRRVRVRLKQVVISQLQGAVTWESVEKALKDDDSPSAVFEALQPWLQDLTGRLDLTSAEFRIFETDAGFMFESKRRILNEEDSGGDENSGGAEVLLTDHTANVMRKASEFSNAVLGAHFAQTMAFAAQWHDQGKRDLRFQTYLRRGDAWAARLSNKPLAKGGEPGFRKDLWARSGLPDGFRHELLSFAQASSATCPPGIDRDIALHLIAAHHGRCRPFAPVVFDPDWVSGDPPHHLSSGVSERFWLLTRKFGWWGLAWIEAVLRLGDWAASAEEKRISK